MGPWDGARRVAVAVSGGADSLALALLARGWGDPIAFVVDHGLRGESASEAAWVREVLGARGIPTTILRLTDLAPGPGIAARARAARYAALSAACRHAGLVDLLVGHHAGDQAETVLMRRRRSSGPDGLAGMAACVETDDIRLLRPLLAIDPAPLRNFVTAAGLVPVDDPTNTDQRQTRARLRREIGTDRAELLAEAARCGANRAESGQAIALELAARASIHPERFAILSPGPLHSQTLASLLRSLAGRGFPVAHIDAWAANPRPGTVAGVQILPAGKLGPGWLLVREAAAIQAPANATPGTVWDGRYRVTSAPTGAAIGSLGRDSAAFRRQSALPAAVLNALPTFRYNSVLSAVPDLDYGGPMLSQNRGVIRHAGLPAAGASFLPC
ncbi:tRNA lysidine(34) synthetase TilS [Acidisphaera sp. L21]|uniref:tRNA lysidine(34) synthetase TilS n=1 Tax=Acidisphaera sp. L21 TaxID=1641851 RepID=UPI00131CB31E|nr:tRNA lysidine(34) synthetase TilS [Acidisphaera sp. L21]